MPSTKDKKVTYRKIVALKNTKLSQAGSSHIEKQDSFFSNTEYPHTEEREGQKAVFSLKKSLPSYCRFQKNSYLCNRNRERLRIKK